MASFSTKKIMRFYNFALLLGSNHLSWPRRTNSKELTGSVRKGDLRLSFHAIGKLARQMEASDTAKPIYRGSFIGVLREHETSVKTVDLCR